MKSERNMVTANYFIFQCHNKIKQLFKYAYSFIIEVTVHVVLHTRVLNATLFSCSEFNLWAIILFVVKKPTSTCHGKLHGLTKNGGSPRNSGTVRFWWKCPLSVAIDVLSVCLWCCSILQSLLVQSLNTPRVDYQWLVEKGACVPLLFLGRNVDARQNWREQLKSWRQKRVQDNVCKLYNMYTFSYFGVSFLPPGFNPRYIEREERVQRIDYVATDLKLAWCKNPMANSLWDVPAGNYGSGLHQNKYPVRDAK